MDVLMMYGTHICKFPPAGLHHLVEAVCAAVGADGDTCCNSLLASGLIAWMLGLQGGWV